jgi:hypothetical protein
MQSLTALQIINRAAMELGLQYATEVSANTEMTGQQMLALLNSAGNDLVMSHTWSELNITYNFSSIVGQASYPVPADYAYYIDQSMWNTTARWPVVGPITPQEWQRLRAGLITTVPRQLFRIQNKAVELYPTPVAGNPLVAPANFTYQYLSSAWVTSGQDANVKQDYIVSDADVPILNSQLLIKALKVKMWNAKGLDTTMLITEYTELFNMLTGKDKGARVLSLSPRFQDIYISMRNIPDGNWTVG